MRIAPPAATFYWACLGIVVASRVVWWALFVVLSWSRPVWRWASLRRVRTNLLMGTKQHDELLVGHALDADELSQRHGASLAVFSGDRNEALVLGSLGLATWGILFSVAHVRSSASLSLELLFVGVTALVVGPTLFRSGGRQITYMGLTSVLGVGYAAVSLALLSALPLALRALSESWQTVGLIAGYLVAAAVVVREVLEVRAQFNQTRQLLRATRQPVPAATAGSPGGGGAG